MPTRYTTAELAEAIEKRPERWAKVTRESALSLPVPAGHAGAEALAFFWYPVGGPAQNRVVGAPTFQVTASLTRLDDITFLPAGPNSLGLGVAPGTALGKPTIGGPVAPGEMKTLKAELYDKLDSVLNLALVTASVTDADKVTVASLNALYHRLAVLVLLPAYHAMNRDFFPWLEQNAV